MDTFLGLTKGPFPVFWDELAMKTIFYTYKDYSDAHICSREGSGYTKTPFEIKNNGLPKELEGEIEIEFEGRSMEKKSSILHDWLLSGYEEDLNKLCLPERFLDRSNYYRLRAPYLPFISFYHKDGFIV